MDIKKVLKSFIDNNYDLTNKKLILMGDGANWIKILAKNLNAHYVLDKFHLVKKVKSIFTFREYVITNNLKEIRNIKEELYNDLITFINAGDVTNFVEHLKALILKETLNTHKWLTPKIKHIKSLIKYACNNQEGIEAYKKDFYIGCQTEAQISHTIKSLKAYSAKAYSKLTFSNMLSMRMAKINRWDPVALVITRRAEDVKNNTSYFACKDWNVDTKKMWEPTTHIYHRHPYFGNNKKVHH